MCDRVRPGMLLAAVCVLLASSSRAVSQVFPRGDGQAAKGSQVVVVGRVGARSGERFALLDDRGSPLAYLTERRRHRLNDYEGRLVAVTARPAVRNQRGVRELIVDQVAPLKPDVSQIRTTSEQDRGGQRDPVTLASLDAPPLLGGPHEDCLDCSTCCPECIACAPCLCGPPGRFWADVQYLLWWTEGMTIPPLVTTSPQGTPADIAGVLGQPGTRILYGNEDILTDVRHGLRLRMGMWIWDSNLLGIQVEYLGLSNENERFFATSVDGNPILARPFFNINPRDPPANGAFDPPARESAQELDTVVVDSGTELYSVGAAFRANLACVTWGCDQYSRVDLLSGYRYLRLKEGLQIREAVMGGTPPNSVSFDIFDRFDTRNEFHGWDLGAEWEIGCCRWSFELLTRTAVGNVRQTVDIRGGTTITTDDASQSFVGGLLAQRTNIGRYSRDRFTVVPELGGTLGYQVRPHWRLTGGYTLLYLTNVVRPGDQIDRDVNPDLLPPELDPVEGAARPRFAFHETSYWAHGIHLGLEGRW